MGFSKQEYWSGLPFPPAGDLPDSWIQPVSLMTPEMAGGFFTTSNTWEAPVLLDGKKIDFRIMSHLVFMQESRSSHSFLDTFKSQSRIL